MQEPRHIDKNHSSIRIHSHWTFKLTNQQIRRYPAEQEYRKACRWLQAYHKHIQARKHATSRMSTQSQKHSRVNKTLKKRKHTDIRTHGHSSKHASVQGCQHASKQASMQAYVNMHITTQAHTAAFTSFATLLIKIVILSCNEHNTYNRSST